MLVPTVVLPKLSKVGLADSCRVCASPVPESPTVEGDPGALLTKEREPEKSVAEVGVKLSVNEAELPGATESGRARPLKANPWPFTVACVTLRLAVPEFWIVIVWVLLDPTATLPKATEVGTMEICGCTPVPDRVIVVGEFVAVLSKVKLLVDDPAADGVKVAPIRALCPAAKVNGKAIPVGVKPVPAAVN